MRWVAAETTRKAREHARRNDWKLSFATSKGNIAAGAREVSVWNCLGARQG
jgi:hypothetical protein